MRGKNILTWRSTNSAATPKNKTNHGRLGSRFPDASINQK
jgi:hypothetical protein